MEALHHDSLQAQRSYNFRAVAGVLAQDYYGPVKGKRSFIASSYGKWLEGTRAPVMPSSVNQTESYYNNVLDLVNGVLSPGTLFGIFNEGGTKSAFLLTMLIG